MEEFAASGIMSARLRTEVTAYQLTLLDDTVAESPHAIVSRVVRGKPYSKPWLWSMELRFKQNVQLMESVNTLEAGIFNRFFNGWKSIVQRGELSRRSVSCIPAKKKPQVIAQMVYRTGKYGLADWSVFRPHLLGKNSIASLERTVIETLQIDYLSAVLEPNAVYSLPQDSGFHELGPTGSATGRPPPPRLFQLVSLKVFNMEHVKTAKLFAFSRWGMPAVLQKLDIHTGSDSVGGSDVIDNYDVIPSGMPESVDLLDEFHWKEWIEDLCHWSVISMSDTRGCIHIAEPMEVSSRPWTALYFHIVT